MQILKNLVSRVTTLWTLYGVVTQINAALKSFPGTGNEIRLRAWLLDHLAILAGLAAKTATSVDDDVVYYSLRIIENDTAWKILYTILLLTGGQPLTQLNTETTQSVIFGTGEQPDLILALYEIDKSLNMNATVGTTVENPMLVISSVGLLLQIIQFLRKR